MINFLVRSFYYFRTGYGIYLSMPIGMISLCTTVYYLAIQNVPTLKSIFPGVLEFGAALVLIVYPSGVVTGWLHLKIMPFYRVEQQIQVEANPYSNRVLTPVMVPMWKLLIEIGRKEGLDVSEMEKTLNENF